MKWNEWCSNEDEMELIVVEIGYEELIQKKAVEISVWNCENLENHKKKSKIFNCINGKKRMMYLS